jgi:hypothetical protein
VKRFPSAIERVMMTAEPVIMNFWKSKLAIFSQLFS